MQQERLRADAVSGDSADAPSWSADTAARDAGTGRPASPGATDPASSGPAHHARATRAPATTRAPLGRHATTPVVVVAGAATAAVAAFDVTLTDRLSMFFDLCFVLVGLTSALLVQCRGLFAVAVLPPLLLGAVVAVLAGTQPATLTASHLAFVSTWLTGLAHHGAALVATHIVVLAIVWLRAAQRAH